MIDTVCLLIPKREMRFLKDVSSWDLYAKTDQYKKFVRNPASAEKATGNYYPRLTGYSRRYSMDENVRMEFSVPKLLYQNNVNELADGDFEQVIRVLQKRLQEMGVLIDKEILKQASISTVHFSKNIVLKDGYTASYIIGQLGKIDLTKTFDFARARYINDGQSICAHTSAHQLIIYDKIADLRKKKKRAIDKDQVLYQMSLFPKIQKKSELREIIRIEARLAKKQKINQLLPKYGFNKDPTFSDVFSSEMSQIIVQDYWNNLIVNKNLFLFGLSSKPKELLHLIQRARPGIKPKQAIYLLGLITLAKDENGIRELRGQIEKMSTDRSWYRIKQDLSEANELLGSQDVRGWIRQIEQALQDYKPLKLKHYEKQRLHN